MKLRFMPMLAMCVGTSALVAGCGAEGELSVLEASPESASYSEDVVPLHAEEGTVTAAACSHNSTRWVGDGCCTQTATRRRQQICIYGAWYSTNVSECYFPTSYCL